MPIFVGGVERSGTTLIRYILDSHPDITCGSETTVFVNTLMPAANSIVRWGSYETFMKPYGLSEQDVFQKFVREPMDNFFEEQCKKNNKTRWADKTPSNIKNIVLIRKFYPDAYFVHMIRDGRDCICSWQNVDWSKKPLDSYKVFAQKTLLWKKTIQDARASVSEETKYKEIQYEKLIDTPEECLRDLIAWLGEDWSNSLLEHHKRDYQYEKWIDPNNVDGSKTPIKKKNYGKWKEKLSNTQIAIFELIAGDLLDDLGYECQFKQINIHSLWGAAVVLSRFCAVRSTFKGLRSLIAGKKK